MSSTSTKLEFNGVQIKAFTDKNGTYWFSSAEICSILSTSKQDLDSSEFKVAMLRDDHGQKRAIHLVNERGVYSLIHASTSSQSKNFLAWWAAVCIPYIHKDVQIRQLTPLEELKLVVSALEDHATQIKSHDEKLSTIDRRVESLERSVTELQLHNNPEFLSVLAYCNINNIPVTRAEAMAIGKKAKKLSRQLDLPIGKAPHEIYGHVGTYHVSVLEQIVGEVRVAQ